MMFDVHLNGNKKKNIESDPGTLEKICWAWFFLSEICT